MKTLLASLLAVFAVSSVASAGSHNPYKSRYETVVVYVKKPIYVKKHAYSSSSHGYGHRESAWGRPVTKVGI